MQDYRNLKVWQRSHQFVLDVYRLTTQLPAEEKFGLTSPIRRSAVSIPSNIAEGSARESDADFSRFVLIAMSSAAELDYQLLLAHEPGYVGQQEYKNLMTELTEIRRMLNAFVQKLKANG